MKPGKRDKVKQYSLQLYPDQVEVIDKMAEDRGVSRSHYLRIVLDVLIDQHIRREEKLKEPFKE